MTDEPTNATAEPKVKKRHGCLKGCLVVFGLLVLLVIGGIFLPALLKPSDEKLVATYQPSPEVADMVAKDSLTTKSKAIIYRSDLKFLTGQPYRDICFADGVEGLACTTGGKIYMLKIDDPAFADHKYSAVVHEMLHIAYNSLSEKEKTRIDGLTNQELAKHQDDYHLAGVIETLKTSKRNSQPHAIESELHSKFGVEYATLSPELESYYQQYFVNRQQVVSLYQNGGFDSRVRRIDQLRVEGKAIEVKLTTMNNQLTAYQKAGEVDKFNALVGPYNALVKQYNAKVAESTKLYNEVITFYKYFNPDYKPPEQVKEQ